MGNLVSRWGWSAWSASTPAGLDDEASCCDALYDSTTHVLTLTPNDFWSATTAAGMAVAERELTAIVSTDRFSTARVLVLHVQPRDYVALAPVAYRLGFKHVCFHVRLAGTPAAASDSSVHEFSLQRRTAAESTIMVHEPHGGTLGYEPRAGNADLAS